MSANNVRKALQGVPEQAKPVLALDFGTSNTYVTKCPGDKEDAVGVDFGGGRDGIATAILYRDGKDPLIGDVALEEFGDAGLGRVGYSIHAQFKPDLAASAETRRYARDFLIGLLAVARRQNKDIAPLQRQVIFGVPSESSDAYRDALRETCRDAGFGDVKTVDEPKGAIYFHIQRKDITPAEALDGTLVVDFGGGTCDFALMAGGEVMHSWGDMHLGGRLFDDLFYQWFIAQNPGAVAAMRREGAEFFVLAVRCREVKEKFSLAMALDPTAVFRKAVGEYGRIGDATWETFLARAQGYRPSETFSEYLRAMNPQASKYLAGFDRGLDLLDWFRQTLRQGLAHERVRGQDLACVILTGGSSAWPFVASIVVEELGHLQRSPRLVHSDRPYVTVSQGLAIVPALQRRLAATQDALRSELPGFVSHRIGPLIERRMDAAAERIAELVAVGLFDERIDPILRGFRQTGGSVASLKTQIAEQAAAFKPRIEAIVQTQIAKALSGVATDTTELMQSWYGEHRLNVEKRLANACLPQDLADGLRIADPDVYGEISGVVLALSTTIVAVVVAVISGGAGTALVATGPVGHLIGAVVGLIAGALVLHFGVEEARRRAELWDGAPIWIIARALTDEKIATLRDDIKGQVAGKIRAQVEVTRQGLEGQVRERVEHEIESLSALSQL